MSYLYIYIYSSNDMFGYLADCFYRVDLLFCNRVYLFSIKTVMASAISAIIFITWSCEVERLSTVRIRILNVFIAWSFCCICSARRIPGGPFTNSSKA